MGVRRRDDGVRDMVVMGLGLGVAMSAYTVIVQNQYPSHRLGEVTRLQFFRSIAARSVSRCSARS